MTEGLANQFTCCSCIPSKYLWSATVLGRLFNKIFPGIQCVHYQPGKVTCEDENIYTESKLVIKWCFMDVSEGIERNLLIDEDVIKLLQRIVDREAYSNQRDLFWSGKKKERAPKNLDPDLIKRTQLACNVMPWWAPAASKGLPSISDYSRSSLDPSHLGTQLVSQRLNVVKILACEAWIYGW